MPLRDQVIARPTVLAALSRPIAPLANLSLEIAPFRVALEKTLRIHRDAPLPQFSMRTFQSWARKHPRPANTKGTVVYFHGCSANSNEPWLAKMTVAVLEHNGYRVVVPPQGCCGLPLQSNGNFEPARKYLRALVARLAPHARKGATIVATSTSCGLMLKREGREMLGVDDPDLKLVGEHTFDICEFLLDLHDRGELRTDFAPLPLKVPYHQPCQGRGHGFGKPALDLLGLIPELDVIEVDHVCCGIAGTYGLKVEKYDIAMQVGRAAVRRHRRPRPRRVGVRLRDVPMAHRQGHRHSQRPPGRAAAPRLRPARPGAEPSGLRGAPQSRPAREGELVLRAVQQPADVLAVQEHHHQCACDQKDHGRKARSGEVGDRPGSRRNRPVRRRSNTACATSRTTHTTTATRAAIGATTIVTPMPVATALPPTANFRKIGR